MKFFKDISFLVSMIIFIAAIFFLSLIFALQEEDGIDTFNYSDELVQRRAHQRIEISIER